MKKEAPFWWPNPQALIALILIVSMVALMFVLALRTQPTQDSDMLKMVVGGFITVGFASIINFYFGSSKESANKGDALTKIATGETPAPPTVTVVPAATSATVDVGKTAAALLFAFIVAGLMFAPPAQAQVKLKTPQQIVNDVKNDVKHAVDPSSASNASSGAGSSSSACDINLFTSLNVANVVSTIQNCVGSVVAAGATPFVTDIKAALDSATAAKDGTAVSCLTPALAIAQAAMGTPAVLGSPEVPAVMSQDGTTVITPEKNAVAGTPAVYPGPILIFQKYREFVTAGGPSNCKTAVQSTINGTMAAGL